MLETKYDAKQVEQGKYAKWLKEGYFKAGDLSKKPYCIVIPPPNVTGKLHIGHTLDNALQDSIILYKRMRGYDCLWLPGMDHAGIATQAKVDARLKELGISRYDLGREGFLKKAWEWKDEYAAFIKEQWAKTGLSVDYSKERFTLDEGLSKAVIKVFVDYYKDGLIYQGKRVINWDPVAKTALSNIEVVHKDVKGKMYYFRYHLVDSDETFDVATTRPETMFGDVCVVVNPKDEKLCHLIGKKCINPANGDILPIIGDEYIEIGFGTGAMKCTPAHDPNDYQIALRHNLEMPVCMNEDATMNSLCGEFEGMDRYECRDLTVKRIEEQGQLVKIEEIEHSVGFSERTDTMVEPYLSKQWFVKMKPLADDVLKHQENEDTKINFYPKRFEKTFTGWLEDIEDWCISRQLWWGHRIPVYYHKDTGEIYCEYDPPKDIENYVQDEDVLDTWFSSALWPFSTLGWPEKTDLLERYFPTDCLVTGYDIIFFWVSRMIFQSLEFTGKSPFHNVLIHGLIRDEEGRKMSKSLGNGIDPMDVIEKYGADALRWFLSNGSAPGQDVRFSYDKMDAAWNFINKIWNVSRYILMNAEDVSADAVSSALTKVANKTAGNVTDRWILTRLNDTVERVTEQMDKFEFGVAGHILYNFIWDEFANWYLELTKEVMFGEDEAEKDITRAVLLHVLDQVLRLLHPIMPFFTEEIFEKLPNTSGSIVVAEYPKVRPEFNDDKASEGVAMLIELITAVRNIRAEVNTPLSKAVPMLIKSEHADFLNAVSPYISRFTNPSELTIAKDLAVPEQAMSAVITGAELYLPLAGLINIEEEIARLEKELAKWQKELDLVNKKLGNERFVANAKAEVVQKEKDKLADYQEKFDTVEARIAELKEN